VDHGAAASPDHPYNNMPRVPEQSRAPEQKHPLNTKRIVSSIPKGDFTPDHQKNAAAGEGKVWVYPSEQQFFNAMRRKGWDAKEEDMRTVVAIHNTVNERSWQEILRWEVGGFVVLAARAHDASRPQALHKCDCPEGPRLVKFLGRPKDPSPKALVRQYLLGYSKPFDRHDWTVDRCGTQVRYVLDFYRGHAQGDVPMAYHIDARPALDSLQALYDRFAMKFRGGTE
jgi:cytochrome c heme-lyase